MARVRRRVTDVHGVGLHLGEREVSRASGASRSLAHSTAARAASPSVACSDLEAMWPLHAPIFNQRPPMDT